MDRLTKANVITGIIGAALAALVSSIALFDRFFAPETTSEPQQQKYEETAPAPEVQSLIENTIIAPQSMSPESDDRETSQSAPDESAPSAPTIATIPVAKGNAQSTVEAPFGTEASLPPPPAATTFDFDVTATQPTGPLQLEEKIVNFPCGPDLPFQFTVARDGTNADNAVYVSEPIQSGRIGTGTEFALAPDCTLRLVRTGRSSRFFAEYLRIEDRDHETN